jgi:hypothetical protein
MSSPECDAWFANVPASQLEQLRAVRALIKSLGAEIVEEFKWSRPCYSNERGIFCYLQSTKKHATLGFQRGASLEDPTSLLEGTGKDMRHVKLPSGAVAVSPALVALLRQAASQ